MTGINRIRRGGGLYAFLHTDIRGMGRVSDRYYSLVTERVVSSATPNTSHHFMVAAS